MSSKSPTQENKSKNDSKNEPNKVSIKRFLDISVWSLKTFYKISPRHVTLYAIGSILKNLQGIVFTYITAQLIEKALEIAQVEGASIEVIYPYILSLFIFGILTAIIGFFRTYSGRVLDFIFYVEMEKLLYKKLMALGVQTLESPDIANKISRASREKQRLYGYFNRVISLISSTISFVISVSLILSVVPIVVPLVIVLSIPTLINDRIFIKRTWGFTFKHTEENRKSWSNVGPLISPQSLKEVIINNAHSFFSDKFTSYFKWFHGEHIKMRFQWFSRMYGLGILVDVGIYIGYILVFSKLILHEIAVGTALFQIRLVDRISRDIDTIVGRINSLYESSVRLDVLMELFEIEATLIEGDFEFPALSKGPDVEFKNVNFSYPGTDKLILSNLNLKIKAGEKIAVVGHNGAGKTTLVKLICRLYTPNSGNIFVDSHDLVDVESSSYFKNLGVLFQDYNTYGHLDVRENVAIGDPKKKTIDKDVIDALKRADAWDFVEKYENGLDQILSERYKGGIRPSTGQWQKIAIARFFYRNAPLVIFDEPTAAIDAVSEYNIFNKIYEFFEGKTVIIISHRFSTVRNADRIIVVENGKIIEQGTHTELLAHDGYYAKSFKLQAEGYSSDPVESIV